MALDLDPDLPPLWADASQISQVLVNLIVNAQEALCEAPRLRRLRIETRFDAAAALARLVLADNGPGVPADLRARIFEPFFTTKPVGLGTGIGLSVCEGIVKSHGGRIAVDETPADADLPGLCRAPRGLDRRRLETPQHASNARQELARVERLGEVVVGAHLEPITRSTGSAAPVRMSTPMPLC